MFTVDRRVYFSNTGADGLLSPAGIVDYFQDCANIQSEDVGGGFRNLQEINRAWFLASWRIFMDKRPAYGQILKVSTIPYKFDKVFGYRAFTIEDESGEILVRGDSKWFAVDTVKTTPVRLEDEMTKHYYPLDERPDMPDIKAKVNLSGIDEQIVRLKVLYEHLDMNRHMNNAWYVRLVDSWLPEGFEPETLSVDYRLAAALGDDIIIYRKLEDDRVSFRLASDKDETYVAIAFDRRKP